MNERIERNVPIPPTGAGRKTRWPFLLTMEVGDSVMITDPALMTHQLAVRLSALSKTGKRFTQRRVDGGVRVWRTE